MLGLPKTCEYLFENIKLFKLPSFFFALQPEVRKVKGFVFAKSQIPDRNFLNIVVLSLLDGYVKCIFNILSIMIVSIFFENSNSTLF